MKFILGKKIGMTQVWRGEEVLAVTKIQAGPCFVLQVKDKNKDGYEAIQVGYGEKKAKNIKQPARGHFKGLGNFRYVREFRIKDGDIKAEEGNIISVETFASGDLVKVAGTSIGKGFQGVVKRHGFAGSKKTHGNKDQLRMPGSIGATEPQRVFKGMRMGGRMGGGQVSVANLEVIEVENDNNILLVKGAVPGPKNGLIALVASGELKFSEKISSASDKKEEKTEAESLEAESAAVKDEPEVVPIAEKVEEKASIASPEEKAEEKKEESPVSAEEKIEEKKEEAVPVVAEEKKEEPKKDYLEKWADLPAEIKAKAGEAEFLKIVNELEDKYQVDLVPIIIKILTKEIEPTSLKTFFVSEYKMEEVRAGELEADLKEKILKDLN